MYLGWSLVLGQIWGHVLLLLDPLKKQLFLAFSSTTPLLLKDQDVGLSLAPGTEPHSMLFPSTFRHTSTGNHKMGVLEKFWQYLKTLSHNHQTFRCVEKENFCFQNFLCVDLSFCFWRISSRLPHRHETENYHLTFYCCWYWLQILQGTITYFKDDMF